MKLFSRTKLLVAAGIAALLAPIGLVQGTAEANVDVYVTDGTHVVNGREWRTTCAKYSSTVDRCRTEIKATVVSFTDGKFTPVTGWAFNNLTYKASPRSQWQDNPLGAYGKVGGTASWVADDGRKWRTECDTALTGDNGCRSFIQASIIESFKDSQGSAQYRWVNKEVFNNMVRFSAETKPTPKPTPSPTPSTPAPSNYDLNKVTDTALRACIQDAAGIGSQRYLTPAKAASIEELNCSDAGIQTLAGFPLLPNLDTLKLYRNELPTLSGLPSLPNLYTLDVEQSQVGTLQGLPVLPELRVLQAGKNQLVDLQGMDLPELIYLNVSTNSLNSFEGLSGARNLGSLIAHDNQISTLGGMPMLPHLRTLGLPGNNITSLAGMPSFPILEDLFIYDNPIASFAGLPVLPELKMLSATNTGLNSLAELPPLPKLEQLFVGSNQLTTLQGMPMLPQLHQLQLYDNELQSLQHLPYLPNLTWLSAADNQLVSAGHIPPFTPLESLFLQNNNISSVLPLASFTSLNSLYLSGNPVTDLHTLQPLHDGGTEIDIWGN